MQLILLYFLVLHIGHIKRHACMYAGTWGFISLHLHEIVEYLLSLLCRSAVHGRTDGSFVDCFKL